MKGKLYLIPSTLGDGPVPDVIPDNVNKIINTINFFIVENERTARRYLLKLGLEKPVDELTFFILNKHTKPGEIYDFLRPAQKGRDTGLLSEAGCPCVADPGSPIVRLAHEKNIPVLPLTGPSSILLALMASGLNGQNFCFNGYLPKKRPERIKKIKLLENLSSQENQTQIFMETPYRNMHVLEDIVCACHADTLLCIAADITLENEFIKTKTIKEWKKSLPEINKRPTIFLLLQIR